MMPTTRIATAAGWGLAGLLMISVPAAADDEGDASAGAAFAQQHCAACHAISGTGPSPDPTAPLFRGLTKEWPAESVAEALAEGIRTAHPGHPTADLDLTVDQIADLVAYIASVQR